MTKFHPKSVFVYYTTDLHLLPLKFVALSLGLEYAPSDRVLGFFLLSEKQIFCLFTRNEQRLANGVRLLQLRLGQQLQLFAVLEPSVVGVRVARHTQRIDFVSDVGAVFVQCHLLAVYVFCLALILDINLQLEAHLDQLVQLAPR